MHEVSTSVIFLNFFYRLIIIFNKVEYEWEGLGLKLIWKGDF